MARLSRAGSHPSRRIRTIVARALGGECRVEAGSRIAAAVSGGSDSVALARILAEAAPAIGATLAGLIHVNHQLRGPDSDGDEAFCRDLAARMQVPIEVRRVDVASIARQRRVSIEVAAREARYRAFEEAAGALDAGLVATGHTLDDQAETILLRLLRGAGTRGLSGIRPRRGRFVRPLLGCSRALLRRDLESRGDTWREDASNDDVTVARNRVRHELLPVVHGIAPGGVRALARLARYAQDDEQSLMKEAMRVQSGVILEAGRLNAAALAALDPAVARRVLRLAAAAVRPDAALSAPHLEAALRLASGRRTSGRVDLPGFSVCRRGNELRMLERAPAVGAAAPWAARLLPVPGVVELPEAGVSIAARVAADAARAEPGAGNLPAACAVLQISAVRLPLLVRNRRPGDRFRPLGAPGTRKLQDVFVDRKIARETRDLVPIVVDADDRIVWVAGVSLAHGCRVTSPEDGVLILEQRTAQ